MSETPKIIDLEKVIEPHLNGGRVLSYSSRYLTKPGDNYGSVMLAINANVQRPSGDIEELPLIAKLPPITNDLYWNIFQPERTCITENSVYKYLAHEFEKLQLEAGIEASEIFNGFPRYYGSRISLDETATKVDRDAVLVQENVQTSGYKSGDRHKPYDMEHTVLILRNIAQYHGLGIALRLLKPDVYNEYVRPYFKKFDMNSGLGAEATVAMNEETLKDIEFATNNNEKEYGRIRDLFELYNEFCAAADFEDGPFNTLVHSDLWINNIMLQYDESGHPQKVKFVDFQIAQYGSLIHDVIFFLLSSVDVPTLASNYENFMKVYYEAFIDILTRVGVKTDEYSYEAFLKEFKRVAHLELPHVFFMTKVILADNSTLPDDFKDVNLSILTKNSGLETITKKLGDIIQLAKQFEIFY